MNAPDFSGMAQRFMGIANQQTPMNSIDPRIANVFSGQQQQQQQQQPPQQIADVVKAIKVLGDHGYASKVRGDRLLVTIPTSSPGDSIVEAIAIGPNGQIAVPDLRDVLGY